MQKYTGSKKHHFFQDLPPLNREVTNFKTRYLRDEEELSFQKKMWIRLQQRDNAIPGPVPAAKPWWRNPFSKSADRFVTRSRKSYQNNLSFRGKSKFNQGFLGLLNSVLGFRWLKMTGRFPFIFAARIRNPFLT